jgi:phosphoglycerate dehydrogenase-like enzyme
MVCSSILRSNAPAFTALSLLFHLSDKVDGPAGKTKPIKIKTVGVIGAGLMGGGIAMCCANAGMAVIIMDRDDKNLARGLGMVTLGGRT